MNKKGFTLIELIIVMIILSVLLGSILGNFFTSLKKERDARRKLDLQQVQKALEMYYQDKNAYPSSLTFGSSLTDSVSGKVYMQSVPNDPQSASNNCKYIYSSPDTNHATYFLYSFIENTLDTGQGVRQTGYGVNCTAAPNTSCNPCRFSISSSNTAPQ